jgi:hypothetical protein
MKSHAATNNKVKERKLVVKNIVNGQTTFNRALDHNKIWKLSKENARKTPKKRLKTFVVNYIIKNVDLIPCSNKYKI